MINCIVSLQKSSQAVSDALRVLTPKYLGDHVLALLQSFACPANMHCHLEPGFSGQGNEPRYRLNSKLQFEAVLPKGKLRDPLIEFFISSKLNKGL